MVRSLRSGLIVSFVITHLNTAVRMHAAGLSYRWPVGARLVAGRDKGCWSGGMEEYGAAAGDSVNRCALGLEKRLRPFTESVFNDAGVLHLAFRHFRPRCEEMCFLMMGLGLLFQMLLAKPT